LKPNVDAVVFDLDATLINLGGFVEWRKAHEDSQGPIYHA